MEDERPPLFAASANVAEWPGRIHEAWAGAETECETCKDRLGRPYISRNSPQRVSNNLRCT